MRIYLLRVMLAARTMCSHQNHPQENEVPPSRSRDEVEPTRKTSTPKWLAEVTAQSYQMGATRVS